MRELGSSILELLYSKRELWCTKLNMFCSDIDNEQKDDIGCDGDCENCPYSEEV